MSDLDNLKASPRVPKEGGETKKRKRRTSSRDRVAETADRTVAEKDTGEKTSGKKTKGSKKFPWKAVLLTFEITAILFGLAGVLLSYNYQEKRYAYRRQTVVIQEGEALEALRNSLEGGDSVMTALRKGFRSYIVGYDSAGQYVFKPINYGLRMMGREPDYVKKLDSGEWIYAKDGRTQSKRAIDVSSHQGDIDWQKVAGQDVKYALIRAGIRGYETGKIVEDEKFAQNAEGALKNGLEIGAYFFSQAVNEAEVDEETQAFLKTIGPYNVTGPVVIDVELAADGAGRADMLSPEERTKLVARFCENIKAAGYKPMIYFNFDTALFLVDIEQLEEYGKWYASYNSSMYYPYYYSIWQYRSDGTLPGIEGNVDFDMVFDW